MGTTLTIFRRELAGYFITPLAAVFIIIFLVLAGALTFFVGNFYARGQADMQPFFTFHPWLYLFLVPAVSMRLWAEERKSGTIELFLTLPVTIGQAVVGKFLAAWAFCTLALALTFPLWLTVDHLGSPDHGVIAASYLGSALMVGAYLAVGGAVSALTKNQVIAFVLTAAVCFVLTVSGSGLVLGFLGNWAPPMVAEVVASFSFLTHFQDITRGVVDARDVVFFLSVIGVFLAVNAILVDLMKGR